jgi:hypothetical protein
VRGKLDGGWEAPVLGAVQGLDAGERLARLHAGQQDADLW